ncbi:MAG: hypothetical protein GF341_09785 [candidate division Zixibacteria bacterium]|nr:hypothetical protein [candidate division Zixibacteria bacterium]
MTKQRHEVVELSGCMMSFVNLRRIICPTDFSLDGNAALDYASELAREFNAELLVLHVMVTCNTCPDTLDVDQTADLCSTCIEEELGWTISRMQLVDAGNGNVRREIVRAASVAAGLLKRISAEKPDLVVMANRQDSTGQSAVPGRVTLEVLLGAPCPVMIIGSQCQHAHRRASGRSDDASHSVKSLTSRCIDPSPDTHTGGNSDGLLL